MIHLVECVPPTSPSWTSDQLLTRVLDAMQDGIDEGIYNKLVILLSVAWRKHLQRKYAIRMDSGKILVGSRTVRDRILAIERVVGIAYIESMPGYTVGISQVMLSA